MYEMWRKQIKLVRSFCEFCPRLDQIDSKDKNVKYFGVWNIFTTSGGGVNC